MDSHLFHAFDTFHTLMHFYLKIFCVMCSCLCGLILDILSADMSKSAQSRKVTTHSSGSLQNTKFLDETKNNKYRIPFEMFNLE